jgi:hypothetical protein
MTLACCNSKRNIGIVENSKRDTLGVNADTINLNGQIFVEIQKEDRFQCLISLSGDSIVTKQDYYHKLNLLDINQDSFDDLRIFVFSNTPNQCENYLFEPKQKVFKFIRNCDLDIEIIHGTQYYYSYNSTGCGDMNWESHLIRVDNWEATNIGLMNTIECDTEKKGIFIYKIDGNSQTEIKALPIRALKDNGNNDKLEYIKNFWTENYKAFTATLN